MAAGERATLTGLGGRGRRREGCTCEGRIVLESHRFHRACGRSGLVWPWRTSGGVHRGRWDLPSRLGGGERAGAGVAGTCCNAIVRCGLAR